MQTGEPVPACSNASDGVFVPGHGVVIWIFLIRKDFWTSFGLDKEYLLVCHAAGQRLRPKYHFRQSAERTLPRANPKPRL